MPSEADVFRALISVLRSGLDNASLNNVQILQNFQPRAQGPSLEDAVYLQRISSRRYGYQSNDLTYNSGSGLFDQTERYYIEAVFQFDVHAERNLQDSNSKTPYDIAELCSAIFESNSARQELLQQDIGILRITDIRNPFNIDDRNQYDQNSGFDLTLTYNNQLTGAVPVAIPAEGRFERV